MDPDASAPELVAVQDDVVGPGPGRFRGEIVGRGHGERVVGRLPPSELLAPLEQWRLHDPHEPPFVLSDQAPTLGNEAAEAVEGHVHPVGPVRHDQDQVALLRLRRRGHLAELVR